jgi:hypothetical protein
MSRYDNTLFPTTHNSYSGGARGTILEQLDMGIRAIEFDFHDDGYSHVEDYRVGHLLPRGELALGGGNPTTPLLRDWLQAVSAWVAANPTATPITLILDSKDNLTDNAAGDLEDFNLLLESVFGARLFTREQKGAGPWPDVEVLQGRVLCVLSGHQGTRASYCWTRGTAPAIAANAKGDVVLVYQSEAKDLRCWTGRIEASGPVVWRRRATYAWDSFPLSRPAVAVNDEGWVVAAHQIEATPEFPAAVVGLIVGRIQDDGRITWGTAERLAKGRAPSVEVSGDEVRLFYEALDGGRQMSRRGTLTRKKRSVDWGKARASPKAATAPLERAKSGARELLCSEAGGTISVVVDSGVPQPVRFRQVAFVEMQKGNDPLIEREALFFGEDAKLKDELAAAISRGLVVRAWGFEAGDETSPPANMPATDVPRAPWYASICSGDGIRRA